MRIVTTNNIARLYYRALNHLVIGCLKKRY